MALRNIRYEGDSILGKASKEIIEMTPRIETLIDDMFETMYEESGVGLAAVQVGILKRLVVIDVTGEDPMVLINPKIIEAKEAQTGYEGCLSVLGKKGVVTRPNYVKVEALDRQMNPFVLEGEEFLARAICHELDHLDGILYVSKVEGDLQDADADEDEPLED